MTFISNLGVKNQMESINERLVLLEELGVSNYDLLLPFHSDVIMKFPQEIFNLLKITLPLFERKLLFIPSERVLGELFSLQGKIVSLDEVSFNPGLKSYWWRSCWFLKKVQLHLLLLLPSNFDSLSKLPLPDSFEKKIVVISFSFPFFNLLLEHS